MDYNMVLIPKQFAADRARGPARFVIYINNEPQSRFGILYADSAKKVYDSLVAGGEAEDAIEIHELYEKELMDFLIQGWRMRS